MGTDSRCKAQDSSLIIDGHREERRPLQAGEEMMLRCGDGRALGQAQGFPVVHCDWTSKGEVRNGGRQGCSYARAKPRDLHGALRGFTPPGRRQESLNNFIQGSGVVCILARLFP